MVEYLNAKHVSRSDNLSCKCHILYIYMENVLATAELQRMPFRGLELSV